MTEGLDVDAETRTLVEAWCDRRCYRALREILAGWPRPSGLTDSWWAHADALKGVRAFASNELTEEESDKVEKLIAVIDRATWRQDGVED